MKALGIVYFEGSTANVEGLGDYRPVAAMSFMGRYRVIDFILSDMTNSGIDNVQVYCKEKPRNLIEHLGSGQHYNINSKRGKLRILYGEKNFSSPVYNHDVANYMLNMQYIEEDPNPYVVLAPSYFIYSIDFNAVLQQHIDSGADVTVLYTNTTDAKRAYLGCDVLDLDKEKKVTGFEKNRGSKKTQTISLEAFVMSKKLFIDLVKKASETSSLYWLKDMLRDEVNDLDIRGYGVRGFVACINSLSEYFRWSMELRDRSVANGCVIDGTVEGSIIGRNVTIQKGAIVRDSIVLPGAYIGEDAKLDHVVVDKYAIIHHVKALTGTDEEPVYVKRRDRI